MKTEIWGCVNDNWIQIMQVIGGAYVAIMRTRAENYQTAVQIVAALEAMD